MKTSGLRVFTVVAVLGSVAVLPHAWAQSGTAPNPPRATAPGAQHVFDKLPPADQKIAQALFDAQTPRRGRAMFSLDQIASMKQSGRDWPEILQRMRERGVLVQTDVDQVVRWYDGEQTELRQQREMEKLLGVGTARKPEQQDAGPTTRTMTETTITGPAAPSPEAAAPKP
jgi:hypothetical protein